MHHSSDTDPGSDAGPGASARPARRALITGASGAIGSAIAERLAHDGVRVIAHAHRHAESLAPLVERIEAAGGSARAIGFDVTDAAATRQSLDSLLEEGPIQIVVNNAGIHQDAVMPGMSSEQWHRVIEVSLHGFFNVTQPLLMPMIRTRWGRIISLSSITVPLGNRGQTNYAAAKAGVQGASRSLALELASRGITVNVVAPGIIESPMTESAFAPEDIARMVPMKRAGRPDEVAALVAFLAGDESGYITGQTLSINGGIL